MKNNALDKYAIPDEKTSRKYLIVSFSFFVVGVIILGYYVYDRFRDEIQKKAEEEIVSVTYLKIQEIEHWRKERIRNLENIQNEAFGVRIRRTLDNPDDPAIQKEMLDWLKRFQDIYGYDRICLHDMNGNERMKTSESFVEMPYPLESYYERIFRDKKIVFEDFYYDNVQDKIYLPLLAGMFDFKNNNAPLGTLIVRIDPEKYLYPLLNSWPIPRKSAELQLVRKEDDYAVFLNVVKESETTTLKNRINIKDFKDIPASRAVSGYKGLYLCRDINGKEVITYMQPVSGTPWFIVAKIETDEVNSALKGIGVTICGIILLILALFVTGITFILKFQRYSYYKQIAKGSEALKESETRFRSIIEFGADGILLGSHDGYIIEANEMACSIIGKKREDLIGEYVTAVQFTKESLENAPLRFDLLKEGKTVVNEREIIRPDGTRVNIEMKTKMMADGSYQTIFRDITEKKKAEKDIGAVKSRFEYVLGATKTGFDIIDEEYNVIYVDPKWADKLGDFRGKKCYEYFMGKNEICLKCAISGSLANGVTTISEEYLEKENRFIEVHTIYLNEKLDGKRLVAEFNIDITDKKEVENHLRNFNAELEKRVEKRTAQLENTNKELESFSYSVSHDLRAPIRHISGFAKILSNSISTGDKTKAVENLNRINESAEKMEKLIDHLLEFSRTGRQEINKVRASMNKVVQQIVEEYKACARVNKVKWIIFDLPDVHCDKNLIRIVWENLIDNSYKYTVNTENSIIEIGLFESKDEYEFYIKDNGVGFDMEYQHKLFGVFQRLHLEKDFPGTGIGLATVRRIIARHGGKSWAVGQIGKGATFYFSLPKVGENV